MTKKRARTKHPQLASQPPEPVANPDAGPECQEMSRKVREPGSRALTPRQKTVLPIMAAVPTIAKAARISGVTERTLYRWMENDAFRDELARLRRECAELARQALQGLMVQSVSILADSMDDPDKALRFRAARSALAFAFQSSEIDKLREEIRDLSEALPVWATHNSAK